MAYQWDAARRRYRDDHGRVVPSTSIISARDSLVRHHSARAEGLVADLIAGTISPGNFLTAMRGMVKDATVAEYMLGRGGRAMMDASDRGRIGGLLRAQYRYLDQFVAEITRGEVSAQQMRNRATLYAESSRGAYERGNAAAWGVTLPTFPGEQECTVRCRCRWRIEEKKREGVVHATWIRDRSAQGCKDCIGNASRYAPLILDMGGVQRLAEQMYEKAEKAEPQVTADLRALEKQIDGDLNRPFKLANGQTVHPLDNRLKTVGSTKNKIIKDSRDDGVTVQKAAANIKDNLRYTYTLNESGYGPGVKTVVDGLDDLGYERIDLKNKWNEPKGYTSVHAIYRTPDGQYFEVQFHTDRTLEVKELSSHPIYEKQKKVPKGSAEYEEYQDQIDALWGEIRDDPPNLSGLPG